MCLQLTHNARIYNVVEIQSCMISELRMIRKQTVQGKQGQWQEQGESSDSADPGVSLYIVQPVLGYAVIFRIFASIIIIMHIARIRI